MENCYSIRGNKHIWMCSRRKQQCCGSKSNSNTYNTISLFIIFLLDHTTCVSFLISLISSPDPLKLTTLSTVFSSFQGQNPLSSTLSFFFTGLAQISGSKVIIKTWPSAGPLSRSLSPFGSDDLAGR